MDSKLDFRKIGMNFLFLLFVGVVGVCFTSIVVLRANGAEEKPRPSGTVDIDQTRISFLISGNGGGGTLHYRGEDYAFVIGGLGVGGIGASRLVATGTVYNLSDPSKFPGVYSELRTGYALGDQGNGKLWLKNSDGVMLELKGSGKGIGLSLGADAVHISYK